MLITIERASIRYGRTTAFGPASIGFDAGSLVALMGPNGSGKTTLLRLLGGLDEPSSGTIERAPDLSFAHVGQHQHHHSWMPITVHEVLAMSRYGETGLLGRFRRRDGEIIDAASHRLEIADLMDEQFTTLSGGQRQRVLVASAIAAEADVLLLDEPITGLDLASQQTILDVVAEQATAGRLVVLSTHHLDEARSANRVLLLAGTVIADGPPADVLTTANLQTAFGERVVSIDAAGRPSVFDDHGHGDHAREAMS